MEWKLLISFVGAFLGGFLSGEVFVRKERKKNTTTSEKTGREMRVITKSEKQEMYN